MAMQAEALTINPATTPNCAATPVCLQATGPETSQKKIEAAIAAYIGASVELYKENVGDGFDTGPHASNYKTTFSNSAADPMDALIEWVGPGFITSNPVFLLVKDGNHSPGWYLFKITVGGAGNWDGKEDLDLQDFWPNGGAISHVTLYGSTQNRVPDGGSLSVLIGMSLAGLAAARRLLGRN
jgi:hypothetical protein